MAKRPVVTGVVPVLGRSWTERRTPAWGAEKRVPSAVGRALARKMEPMEPAEIVPVWKPAIVWAPRGRAAGGGPGRWAARETAEREPAVSRVPAREPATLMEVLELAGRERLPVKSPV